METDSGPTSKLDRSPRADPWQFSLRGLLLFTTLVSVLLAIGVYYAGPLAFVIAFGVIQAGMLLAADWLIRPANRRALAVVTAMSWIMLGSGLIIFGWRDIYSAITSRDPDATWTFGSFLAAAGALCSFIAWRRWRRLSRQPRAKQ